jgi:hypothetical protein
MIDEGFVKDQAGLGHDPAGPSALDPTAAALLWVGTCVATWSPGVCLEWSTGRALAAGSAEDEIANALLAIAQVAGLDRSSPQRPMWRLHRDMTSRPRWRSQTVTDARVDVPADEQFTRWR